MASRLSWSKDNFNSFPVNPWWNWTFTLSNSSTNRNAKKHFEKKKDISEGAPPKKRNKPEKPAAPADTEAEKPKVTPKRPRSKK